MPQRVLVTVYTSSKRAKTRKTVAVSLNRRQSNRSLVVLLGKQKQKHHHQKMASSPNGRRRLLVPHPRLVLRVVRYQNRPAATRMSRSWNFVEQRNTRTVARLRRPKQKIVSNQPNAPNMSITVTVKSLIRRLRRSRTEQIKTMLTMAAMMWFATTWKSHRHEPRASERTLEVTMILLRQLILPSRKRSPVHLERVYYEYSRSTIDFLLGLPCCSAI
jgi:hypothetical protein